MSTVPAQPQVYLLDVEGTTSPLSLVSEQLFPYARRHLDAYLRTHVREPWIDAQIEAELALLAEENARDRAAVRGEPAPLFLVPEEGMSWESAVPDAVAYLHWLMDRDCKSTALKALQGRVWRQGYEGGELVGTMFGDVPAALVRWSQTAKVAIYSSGSVEAQQLIFRHSSAGDLTRYITAYFDTRTGPKTEAASYRAIAGLMGADPGDVLFISDSLKELDAARDAGCGTLLSLREGNAAVAAVHGYVGIASFAEIVF